ncbi:biotin/lipoyl-binding carrier protein [Nocardia otitidiscaviarum]|uniref:Biotin/lipoyl-binding carrier protein n=1 Tax=Nocardia otitidiscaviarum TaxID=1823 RepID=A0A378Y9A9_9NOCA|nr:MULTISPECIES: biotin/lipoyl-binding carrier protein [Nocardia]MBF6131941.1 biotin/lipoyl-binding carrier protein [Nocardia otitidiscaviarum]MBF6177985.1 biotin/lipoyl-binding carrier protein [Nocardia otitidiscaviarum]MBF6238604.1 biotin/lipoyl-binding carrier protein [Nocardia otitidiscaviarum]MBF6483072.1 biotin/lipoyl-binding carrier protein [Nocardia otitidiscaviarum]QDP77999.1 biotin/lipoyl-binding carrier protein [Nocardia otitidiscaviarum]
MAEEVLAEMVSTVQEILVSVGDKVKVNDPVIMLESMKMEIPVVVESDGTVASIDVTVGQVLQKGDLIATIA